MKKIAITTTTFAEYDKKPVESCRERGYEVVVNPYGRKIKPEELLELAKDAVGLVAGTETIAEESLLKLKSLKVISRCGAGIDNVDVKAAGKLGIKVFNTPDAPTLAVAELTVGLILNLLRKVRRMDAAVREGKWEKLMGNLVSGKKVGLIGFGRIGRKVAGLLGPFGCEITYADPFIDDGVGGFKRLSLQEVLSRSDIVSIHVPAGGMLIGENEIGMMKKGSWLVNASRGGVVDEGALCKALKSGHLSGAALDVFAKEPYEGALKGLDNVILTPHIGSYAVESRIGMEMEAVKNLLNNLDEVR
ncbi:MAG: phosphoglycerate dehydrogenase [Candidatus Omnitrophota bacterium]